MSAKVNHLSSWYVSDTIYFEVTLDFNRNSDGSFQLMSFSQVFLLRNQLSESKTILMANMVDPASEDDGVLREWAPLTALLHQIPPKAQRGLFTSDLNLTCVAAVAEFLAIGTNHGLVYWYNRASKELQRLRCENTACAITCIGTISSVDYMIAAGADNGIVTVFVVPKELPHDIPDIFKPATKKQVERYTVSCLHSAPVSSVEWSTNGMKLFSGDQKGLVVLTEMDFYMHLSKSVEVLNEKYEVVQLSYFGSQQMLLVSTLYRTIVCERDERDNRWKVSQVGNKERKMLGKFGATFFLQQGKPRLPNLYSCRPGLRIWLSDSEGIVLKTLIFKDAVLSKHSEIRLLNATKSRSRLSRGEPQFGPLLPFKDHLLVTYSADALLILDPETISVVAALYDVQRISALCVTKNEIFVLEGERHLIRLGFSPEEPSYCQTATQGSAPEKPIPIASQFMELTAKLRDSSIFPAIPLKKLSPIFSPTRSSGSSDGEQVSECMEAQELPPVLALDTLDSNVAESVDLNVSMASISFSPLSEKEAVYTKAQRSKTVSHSVNTLLHSELLDKIGEEQFDEVVYQPKRKPRKFKNKSRTVNSTTTESGSDTTSIRSATSETDEMWTSERMDVSSEWSNITGSTSRRSSTEDNHVKNCAESASEDDCVSGTKQINEEANEILSKIVLESFRVRSRVDSAVKEDMQLPESYSTEQPFGKSFDSTPKKFDIESFLGIGVEEKTGKCDNHPQSEKRRESVNIDDPMLYLNIDANDKEMSNGLDSAENQERSLDEKMVSLSSTMSYGPPSGSSQLASRHSSIDLELTGRSDLNPMESSGWLQFTATSPVLWVSLCSNYLVALDAYNIVHYSGLGGLGLKWQRADCKASQLVLSPSGSCVWRLEGTTAFALENPATSGPHGDQWVEGAQNIRSIAVGEDVAWLVTDDGKVLCQKGLTPSNPVSKAIELDKPKEWPASKVVCYGQAVWVLSSAGEVYMRSGISCVKQEGSAWQRVNIPVPGTVQDIALGTEVTGWIIDLNNTLMFSVDHMEREPHWWQFLISEYIFQQTSPFQQLQSCMARKNFRPSFPGRQGSYIGVASGKHSIWIFRHSSTTLHANKTKFAGHRWTRVPLKGVQTNTRWQAITAEGIFENKGQLWCLSDLGDLYCIRHTALKSNMIKKVLLPSADGAVCLAATSLALWLLTSSGEIYIRQGLSNTCMEGNQWRKLSLTQIEGVHFSHVSCGCDVVWACDTSGNTYMAVSSPHAMATSTFAPVWIPVDTKDQSKIFFVKVFVGSQTFMVWALDNKGRVYVREAIFPDFQLGTSWVLVTGITAVDLSISATNVWALSTEGDVYFRYGVTQNNYIGDYWEKIPGAVEAVTASMCDRLWGIDKNGCLLRHTQLTIQLNCDGAPALSRLPSVPSGAPGVEDDWEVV